MTETADGQALVAAIEKLASDLVSAEDSKSAAQIQALQGQLDAATAALTQEKQDHADDLAAAQAAVASAGTPAG